MPRQALEKFGETQKRPKATSDQKPESKQKRGNGSATMAFLKDKADKDFLVKKEELEWKKNVQAKSIAEQKLQQNQQQQLFKDMQQQQLQVLQAFRQQMQQQQQQAQNQMNLSNQFNQLLLGLFEKFSKN